MAWNRTYWDIHEQLYWEPSYLGLKSIPERKLVRTDETVAIPLSETNARGPLYRRLGNAKELRQRLHGYEEILNHIFDLTFAIAPDDLINRTLVQPLGLPDGANFETLRRSLGERYGWGQGNTLQPDGLFVCDTLAVAVELKLDARSSPNQVMKYAALLTWEEIHGGKKLGLGLLYIVPKADLPMHWHKCGLSGPTIDAEFLAQEMKRKLPPKIAALIEKHPDKVRSTLSRMQLHAISWHQFRDLLLAEQRGLDVTQRGDQTLFRLMNGLLAQLEVHRGTGLDESN